MLKKPLSALLSLFILLSLLLSLASCEFPASDNGSTESTEATTATGKNPSDPTAVALDFYVINDLRGHVGDGEGVGIGQVATYLKKQENQNRILLSTGDMWQGTPESNNTKGKLVTEWMNELGFDAMIPGNHEFDWGQEAINENVHLANFPFLAINIYDKATDKPSDFCTPSVMLARENVKIGIIGAIGDVYSSISAGKVKDCYFKVGDDLTALVKEESRKLRLAGADVVVYAIHDGYSGRTNNPSVPVKDDYLEHYDTSLSDGYVDLVFEGHTHTQNIYTDKYGVYHLQGGSNNNAIAHVKMTVNQENQTNRISKAELVKTSSLGSLQKDPNTMSLFQKYADMIGNPHAVIGQNSVDRGGDELRQLCADLYLEVGMEKWGNTYDIFLGGGYISCRSPGYLPAGEVSYADIQTLFPFDNDIVLCSIQGEDLIAKFITTSNSNYFIKISAFGKLHENSIDPNGIYYVITDTYSADYAPNNLTVVDVYSTDGCYARDLIADYIRADKYS